MGTRHSTYAAYGVHVPRDKYNGYVLTECERLDQVIKDAMLGGTDVGHLTAGRYDRNELFIVCSPPYKTDDPLTDIEIELGTHRSYPASWFDSEQRCEWDSLIRQVAAAAGYGDLGEPGWLVVPGEG